VRVVRRTRDAKRKSQDAKRTSYVVRKTQDALTFLSKGGWGDILSPRAEGGGGVPFATSLSLTADG